MNQVIDQETQESVIAYVANVEELGFPCDGGLNGEQCDRRAVYMIGNKFAVCVTCYDEFWKARVERLGIAVVDFSTGEVMADGASEPHIAVDGYDLPEYVHATPTRLVIRRGVSFASYKTLGETLRDLQLKNQREGTMIGWWIADFLLYGEGRGDWGEMYQQASLDTGKAEQTLANLASIGKRFPPEKRVEGATISHHFEVSGLTDDEATDALEDVLDHNLSVRSLREQVERVKADKTGEPVGRRAARKALGMVVDKLASYNDVPDWARLIVDILVKGLLNRLVKEEAIEFVTHLTEKVGELYVEYVDE